MWLHLPPRNPPMFSRRPESTSARQHNSLMYYLRSTKEARPFRTPAAGSWVLRGQSPDTWLLFPQSPSSGRRQRLPGEGGERLGRGRGASIAGQGCRAGDRATSKALTPSLAVPWGSSWTTGQRALRPRPGHRAQHTCHYSPCSQCTRGQRSHGSRDTPAGKDSGNQK